VDAVLVPTEFVAVTVKVYAVPLLKPVIVIGDDVLVAVIRHVRGDSVANNRGAACSSAH